MLLSLLAALTLTSNPPLPDVPVTQWLVRCDATDAGLAAALPALDVAAVDGALATGAAASGWKVTSLPATLSPSNPCWLITRLGSSAQPRAVWIGRTQAALTAYLDGAQLWTRGKAEGPYWRADQGFSGFVIPAPLLGEAAPRLLVLKVSSPFGQVRMTQPRLIDPSTLPEHAFHDGGAADAIGDSVAVLLWAITLGALFTAAQRRSSEILYFALGTAGYAALIHGMSVQWAPFDHTWITRASSLSLFLAMPFYALFFQRVYGMHRSPVFARIAWAQLAVVALLSVVVPVSRVTALATWTLPLYMVWFVYSIVLNVRAYRARHEVAQTVIFGFALNLAAVTLDAIRYFADGELLTPIFPIGVLAFASSILVALAQRFTRLTRESSTLLNRLQSAGASVNAIVVSLQAASSQLSSATAEQVTALTETASTTTEMNQTSAVSANRCVELISKGEAAASVVETGRTAADTSLGAIHAISSSLSSVSGASRELAEKVQRIDRIIDTVSFLADQSAALAINASIEASRAGEAGQGFAAVAREVRSLANDSRRATSEVREVLDEIRTRTAEMETQVSQGGHTVEDGVREVTKLAEVVVTLGGTIQNAVGLMRQVESSARQHQVGVEQVLQAVTNIQRASESIRDGAESLTQLSRQANTLSSGLAAPVSR